MFRFRLWIVWMASVFAWGVTSSATAENPTPMQIRVYQVTPDFPENDDIPIKTPREILIENGIPFPDGSAAILDRVSWRLTVRNTPENLVFVDEFMNSTLLKSAPTVILTLTLIQGPTAAFANLIAKKGQSQENNKTAEHLLTQATSGSDGLRIEGTYLLSTQSGYEASLQSAKELNRVQKVETDKESTISINSTQSLLGMALRVEPTVGADDETIDLNISLHSNCHPKEHHQFANVDVSAPNLAEQKVNGINEAQLVTALTMRKGNSALIGIWHASAVPRKDEIPQSVAAVIRCDLPQKSPTAVLPIELAESMPEQAAQIREQVFSVPMDFVPSGFSFPECGEDPGVPHLPKLTVPSGTIVRLKQPGKLEVKSTAAFLDRIRSWNERLFSQMAETVALDGIILEAPAAVAQEIIAQNTSSQNHQAVLSKAMDSVSKGEIKLIDTFFLESKKGASCSFNSAQLRQTIEELSWNREGVPFVTTDHRRDGISVEASTLTFKGERAVEITLGLEHHFAPAESHLEAFVDSASRQKLEIPREDFCVTKFLSSFTLNPGEPRLVGAWCPGGENSVAPPKKMQLLFLTCHLIRHEPKASSILATQPEDQLSADFMNQMITRVIRVPPDFLEMAGSVVGSSPPNDPFASKQTPKTKRRLTAEQILKENGIDFPKGASAIFNPVGSVLIMTNTRANLLQIKSLVTVGGSKPKTLYLTAHLYEGNATMLRKLVSEGAHRSDHRTELNQLQEAVKSGTVKALGITQVITKSGQLASGGHSNQVRWIERTSINEEGALTTDHRITPVGFVLEVEPTMGADGHTVDLNYKLGFHTDAPVNRTVSLSSPFLDELERKKHPPITLPLVDFHQTQMTSSIALTHDYPRILGLWSPKGPQYENQEVMQIAILEVTIKE